MSKKNKQLVSLLEVLRTFKTMSEFKIIKHSRLKDANPDSKVEEGDMILVGFSYKSAKFQLFERISDTLGLHRLSLSINIDKNIIPESIVLEKVVNDFNRSRLGVKLVINTTSENDTVLTFSVEIISSGIKEAFDKDSIVNFIEILASTPSNVLESLNQAKG